MLETFLRFRISNEKDNYFQNNLYIEWSITQEKNKQLSMKHCNIWKYDDNADYENRIEIAVFFIISLEKRRIKSFIHQTVRQI